MDFVSDPAPNPANLSCPAPLPVQSEIQMAHGGGGRLTQQLIDRVFAPAFCNPSLEARHDGAVLVPPAGVRLAFSTDSHVVSPLFFPGGDIGRLAVCGTLNDLAMCGARPRWLSAGFILEEGLPLATLESVVRSMGETARTAEVEIVAGDTKVVERGKGDGLYVNTTGIGWIEHPFAITPGSVRAGDIVLLSGDIGRHGMAIMAQRDGLAFESPIVSDCAPLWPAVAALLAAGIEVHCLRDLTRGGLATAVIEIAEKAGVAVTLDAGAHRRSANRAGGRSHPAQRGRRPAHSRPPQRRAAPADLLNLRPGSPTPATTPRPCSVILPLGQTSMSSIKRHRPEAHGKVVI